MTKQAIEKESEALERVRRAQRWLCGWTAAAKNGVPQTDPDFNDGFQVGSHDRKMATEIARIRYGLKPTDFVKP